jgi:CRP/FNR family cyclic AMP-dependent transcriptional regulator
MKSGQNKTKLIGEVGYGTRLGTKLPEQLLHQSFSFRAPSERIRSLSAISLASKVAYLRLSDIVGPEGFEIDSYISKRAHKSLYREGELVYPAKGSGQSLFILRRGILSLLRASSEGRPLFIKTVQSGSVFGEIPWIGQTMLGAEAEAAELSEVAILAPPDIEEMFTTFTGLATRLLGHLGPKLVDAEKRYERAAFFSVNAKVASILLDLASDTRLVTGVTQLEMAEMLGVYRETVNLAIANLKRAGLISTKRGRITILDQDALRALCLV